jgi:hypothetical protein
MIDLYFLMVMTVAFAWCWGFAFSFRKGEVLGKPGEWMRTNLYEWFTKPTFDCPFCMSSVHGSIFFWIFLNDYPIIMWPIFVVCLTGWGAIIDK